MKFRHRSCRIAGPLSSVLLIGLDGVGPKIAKKLEKVGLRSVQDLLFHVPFRYEDRTRIHCIEELYPGLRAAVQGKVIATDTILGSRKILVVKIGDGKGVLSLCFFNFNSAMKSSFIEGYEIRAHGEVKQGNFGLEMVHPQYHLSNIRKKSAVDSHLTPIYRTTQGLSQSTIRNLIKQSLALVQRATIKDLIPPGLYRHQITLEEALYTIHRPSVSIRSELLAQHRHPAQLRLIIEELLARYLSTLSVICDKRQCESAPSISNQSNQLAISFLKLLPFRPTVSQERVVREIQDDLSQSRPMMRLVQGDVGSGKTLVAALAALTVIERGYQVALMAPTELLSEQHARDFEAWFTPLRLKVGQLSGKLKGQARSDTLDKVANGSIDIIVGTQALFQEQVKFSRLALIIIDEQHRFGVHQRLSLRKKGAKNGCFPHQLIMTATPIPRTLAMTIYASFEVSSIDELPPGRVPVRTVAIPDTKRDIIIQHVHDACIQKGRQAYWVCTLIDQSNSVRARAAEETGQELQRKLPDVNIGLVHGRMSPAEKEAVMQCFKHNQFQLLVATTVVEVGVDVPNSSLMIIENSERLGLAQLHQLRGRVGRSSNASYCILLYRSPLSEKARKRLGVMRESNDGFLVAQRDLEARGFGELLGTRQTGLASFKVADPERDQKLIPKVKYIAKHLHDNYPERSKAIIQRWLGENHIYSKV